MATALRIEVLSGDLVVNGLTITERTTPSDLPTTFKVGAETDVFVVRDNVPCRFAHATVDDCGQEVRIELRFERGVLVSVFFQMLAPASHTGNSSWYESAGTREEAHLKWLQEKLGAQQRLHTQYPWGVAGVARDKSGDVYAFLHNKSNTWAN